MQKRGERRQLTTNCNIKLFKSYPSLWKRPQQVLVKRPKKLQFKAFTYHLLLEA